MSEPNTLVVVFNTTPKTRSTGKNIAFYQQVADELVVLGAEEPFICGDFKYGPIKIGVIVNDIEDQEEAIKQVAVLIRTACHAAGGDTSDWPDFDKLTFTDE